jgi:hypothetical protein
MGSRAGLDILEKHKNKTKLWPFKHSITRTPSMDHLLQSTYRDQFSNWACVLSWLPVLVMYKSNYNSVFPVGG